MNASVIQGRFPNGLAHLRSAIHLHPVQRHAVPLAQSHTRFATTGGTPLPPPVQALMQEALGADFADVRVHVGAHPAAIGAQSFTHGSRIYFAHGQYDPATPHGLRTVAHELAHVVQQRAGRVQNPFASGYAVVHDPRLEAEAARMADRALTVQRKMASGGAAVGQPFLGGLVAGALGYVPYAAVALGGAWTVNSLVERQTGRNVVGHATYWASRDAVVREVMDAALQAGQRPYSTQTYNGYSFSLDAYCRVTHVTGTLSRRNHARTYGAIDPLVKATNDQAGHLIADSLNGPIISPNFVGMTPYNNNAIGAGPDDDCYCRMEAAVRFILDHETLYVRGRGEAAYDRVTIAVRLTYPVWNATSRNTKLAYWRPSAFDVQVTAFTAAGDSRAYDNPYLGNAIVGHLGVRSIYTGGEFTNPAPSANRYLIGDIGYP